MKTISLLLAALFGSIIATNAFTLDAVGYEGGTLSENPFSISIPGYGELVFESTAGTPLVVNSAYQNSAGFSGPSLNFQPGDVVRLTFSGASPTNMALDFVGLSANEAFVVQKDIFTPQAFLISLEGSGSGAGVQKVSWDVSPSQVPEPAAALIGGLGCAFLLLRRRR